MAEYVVAPGHAGTDPGTRLLARQQTSGRHACGVTLRGLRTAMKGELPFLGTRGQCPESAALRVRPGGETGTSVQAESAVLERNRGGQETEDTT